MSKVVLVNEHDEVIGSVERDDRNKTDIIRVAGLIVYNTKNETLIARRSHNKVNDPDKWGPSVAGTVEEGETYVSNIIKEAQEEIGLVVHEDELTPILHSYQVTSHKYFCTLFSVVADKPISDFVIQEEEVSEICWVATHQLIQWFEAHPEEFIPTFIKIVDILKAKLSQETSTGST